MNKRSTFIGIAFMIAAVLYLYFPPQQLYENLSLLGLDYHQFHLKRIAYAREALILHAKTPPSWFTKELLGSPFWSNIQNFPWIPSRLLLLLLEPESAYGSQGAPQLKPPWSKAQSSGLGQTIQLLTEPAPKL